MLRSVSAAAPSNPSVPTPARQHSSPNPNPNTNPNPNPNPDPTTLTPTLTPAGEASVLCFSEAAQCGEKFEVCRMF
eukprot:scaffold64615_cov25-Phaeocystis_antarctica.AAC.1